ncbi:MAG: PQQ-binding-like beta-propeller repeat protein, partial [Methanocorpusculum sp.]|nr:PQQ-binding-like beta-propeller repeat protein [Methanocorpusculum sp.]
MQIKNYYENMYCTNNKFIVIIFALCIAGCCILPASAGPADSSVQMHISVDGGVDSTAAVNGSQVYFANWKSMDFNTASAMGVACYNISTGEKLWFRTIGEVLAGLTVENDRVFAATKNGELFCLNETTGETVWSVSGISANSYWGITGKPLVLGSTVYLYSNMQKALFGYDTANGVCVLRYGLADSFGTSLIYAAPTTSSAGNILLLTGTAAVELTPENSVVNAYQLPAFTTGSSIIEDGGALFFNAGGVLYCINTTGVWHETWNVSTETATTPAVTAGVVYVAQNGNLAAYNRSTGEPLDGFTTHVSGGTSGYLVPAVDETADRVYYAMNDMSSHGQGKLYCLNASTGSELWSFTLPAGASTDSVTFFGSSPILAGDHLVIGSEGAGVYVFGSGSMIEVDGRNQADKPFVPAKDAAVLYSGTVAAVNSTGSATVRDALDAAVSAGGFTYNLTAYNTIADINGIQNAADYSKTWITDYYTNNDVVPYSVDDPIVPGATISLHYDVLNTTTWTAEAVEYLVNVTVAKVIPPKEVLYEGTITYVDAIPQMTVRDALDAAASAGGFTYNLSAYNTIADINSIENSADWSKSWMTDYYNNDGTPVYSVDDPVVAGAKISLHYDVLDTNTWE